MTKTEIRKLAQQSTQYGYFDHGTTLSVWCPLRRDHNCPATIEATYSMWATDSKGKRMSKIAQLRAAVAEHLTYDHS